MIKKEEKQINDLLRIGLDKKYKDLCDMIKVSILDNLIKVCASKPVKHILKEELILIREGVNNLRKKESENELEAIKNVINHLLDRGNDNIEDKDE